MALVNPRTAALVRRARVQAGETVLVHGAAGGVGTAAIQLGRALGLRTVAVASDEAKREFALRCGAHHAVLSHGWLAAVRELLGERAVDIVVASAGFVERVLTEKASAAHFDKTFGINVRGVYFAVQKARWSKLAHSHPHRASTMVQGQVPASLG